jgi:hypothetical protein
MEIWNRVVDYFDLSGAPAIKARAQQSNHVFPQYIALVLGIIVQPFLDMFIRDASIPSNLTPLGFQLIFSVVIGVAIFPSVYRRSWDNSNPLFVQLCSIFSAGLGWQTLYSTGARIVVSTG